MFLHVLLCILSANIGRHGCCISGFIPGLTHNNSETVLLAFTWQILAISTHSNWAMLEDMSTPTHMPVLCPPPHLTPPISDLPKLTPYMECLTGGDNRIYLILALATFTHSLSLFVSHSQYSITLSANKHYTQYLSMCLNFIPCCLFLIAICSPLSFLPLFSCQVSGSKVTGSETGGCWDSCWRIYTPKTTGNC